MARSNLLLITQKYEALYWIKIMIKSELIPQSEFQNMIEENEQIIKILTTSIIQLAISH